MTRHLAVIHFKPDCTMRGLAGDGMDYLLDRGFQIKAFRLGSPSRELLWVMHGRGLDWRVDDWFHNIRLYEFGPVLTLLLRLEDLEEALSAQERLRQLKGGALPSLFRPGTLRGELGAVSRIFNLVHCADETGGAMEEAGHFFRSTALNAAADPGGERVRPSEILTEIRTHGYRDEYANPGPVWIGWKHRIRHAYAVSAADEAISASTEALIGRLDSEAADVVCFRALLMLMERLQVYSSILERYLLESHFLYRDADRGPNSHGMRTT